MGATLTISPQQLSAAADLGSSENVTLSIRNNGAAWKLYNLKFNSSGAEAAGTTPSGASAPLFQLVEVDLLDSSGSTIATYTSPLTYPISVAADNILNIVVKYTPYTTPDYGVPDTDALILLSDAPGPYPPGSTNNVVLFGMGLTEGVQYSLADAYYTAAGTVKSYIFVDPSLPALTVPASVGIKKLGKIIERIDQQVGVVEVDNVELIMSEDYSTYADGFWYHILNGDPQRAKDVEIMLTIMEGTDETFLFRGVALRDSLEFDEFYVDQPNGAPSKWVRGVKMQLASGLERLKNVQISALVGECEQHTVSGTINSGAATFITLRAVLASALRLAFGQAYDDTLLVNNTTDFFVNVGGTNGLGNNDGTDYNWPELYLTFEYLGGMGAYLGYRGLFFDSTASGAWINRYGSAYELLAHIALAFGAVPRYTYGDGTGLISATAANNKSRIELNSRGAAGSTASLVTMNGGVLSSKPIGTAPMQPLKTRVSDFFGSTHDPNAADTDYAPAAYFAVNGVEISGQAPAIGFDLDLLMDFYQGSATNTATNDPPIIYRALFYQIAPAPSWAGVKVYDYKNATYRIWQAAMFQTWENAFAVMSCYYFMQRFHPGQMQIAREYSSMQSTLGGVTSQRNTRTLMITQIDDGEVTRNFYASAVEKDVENNRAQVTWAQN